MNFQSRPILWIGLAGTLSVLSLAAFVPAHSASKQVIAIGDVVKQVSAANYEVLEGALKVYQAKESIEVARGNLLPSLNLWKVAGIPMQPAMILNFIEDIVPFLVPANWFRFEEAKILYLGEKEGYRALWANELLTAKGLYLHALLDGALLDEVNKSIQALENLYVIVKSREDLGGLPDGGSRDIRTRILSLQEDRRSLQVLENQEMSSLSYLMGYPAETLIALTAVAIPPMETLKPIDYSDFIFRVLDSSPELRQYGYFIDASDFVRKEIVFSFLGGSSASRGMGSGLFDNIPAQAGLGFGTGPSLRIASAQKDILKVQLKAATETVKRQLKLLADNYNLDLANAADLKLHRDLAELTLQKLFERLSLGENIDTQHLVEASRNQIEAETSYFAVQYRFISNQDRLMRLLFDGDYGKVPAAVELVTQAHGGANP